MGGEVGALMISIFYKIPSFEVANNIIWLLFLPMVFGQKKYARNKGHDVPQW